MAGLTEFYCGWNEPSHASQFKWLEYTFNYLIQEEWSGLSKYALSMIRQILLCLPQQAREIALETKDKEGALWGSVMKGLLLSKSGKLGKIWIWFVLKKISIMIKQSNNTSTIR